ncbi:copper chaperone PCu(A)C [Devosia riboflavina]|uniref:copper chaperone PCu(A)C n=1 Tax=Devosia riboflavina TaxID=46914 RepID=UPI00068C9070|nr:copper chaperone PCu(A)C [Devosia riboflavina]
MTSSLRPFVLPLLLLTSAPALAQDHAHDDHEASLGAITVIHAWTRATAEGGDAVVFFEIENAGDPVVLNGAEAEIAGSVEVVGATMGADGAMAYQPVGEFQLPGGGVDFDPNGLGLRLNDLTVELKEGDHFPLHLLLGDGELEISVEVEASDAMAHSHAGHSH